MPTSMAQIATASVSPAFHVQVAVIGAGVIGLAIARSLAQSGKEVLILEKASTIGSETSSRNSEVIHAGIYYPRDSLKAKFCVAGRRRLYDYIQSRHIPHKKCGKLIVATQPEQLSNELRALHEKARRNGVEDLETLSREDVRIMEPNVDCHGALWSPSTGVVDSHSFMYSLLADAEDHNAQLVLNTSVDDAAIQSDDIFLKAEGAWIQCDFVVNTAGLWANQIASTIHRATKWQPPRLFFAKGNYFRLQGKAPFRRLIYPLPEPGGLGVHATVGWSDPAVRFGPDVEWLDPMVSNPADVSLDVDPTRGDRFYSEVHKYWSGLQDNQLVPDYTGIRPKLNHPSLQSPMPFEDFRICGPETHAVPGLIHLFGIESPGLTSSMAIAEHISTEVSTR